MELEFYKYQGTGNDFILIDNRDNKLGDIGVEKIRFMCNRRTGIGADGLMLLNSREGYDFEMKYYNADGNEGSMCGNGGRCLVKFAYNQGMRKTTFHFLAVDGPHEAEVDEDGIVSLKMKDVDHIETRKADLIIDTGSPHYIRQVKELKDLDVFTEGRDIRNNTEFAEKGINVNFVEAVNDDEIFVRTYERGVEDETLSCGTGVTAAALAFHHNENGFNEVIVHTRGGRLSVEYDRGINDSYKNIWLCGPAKEVFQGRISLDD